MSVETTYTMRGDSKGVYEYLKGFNPNAAIPDFAKTVFSDLNAVATGVFNYPTLACLRYFCGAKVMFTGEPRYLSREVTDDKEYTNSQSMYATASLCELAEYIGNDTDIPDRTTQGGVKAPMIPMNGIMIPAIITIPWNSIAELIDSPAEPFSDSRNQFGLPVLPNAYLGDEYVSRKIFGAAMAKVSSGKFSMFLRQDEATSKWYEDHYFRYASNKEHIRKFSLASYSDRRGMLSFFGATAKGMQDSMNVMKNAQLYKDGGSELMPCVRAVVTSPIRDMFAFMLHENFKIIAVRKMPSWINNPIDVSPTIVSKYAVRLSEPVAVVKGYIKQALVKEPEHIASAIDSFFNGHMVDYILEFKLDEHCGDILTDATAKEFENLRRTAYGVAAST